MKKLILSLIAVFMFSFSFSQSKSVEKKELPLNSKKAIEYFPENNLDNSSWGSWCKSISSNTEYKGRVLFISLRKAITGHEYGPELSNLLPLIGKDKILSRMSGKKS